jgi:hypothetical protein
MGRGRSPMWVAKRIPHKNWPKLKKSAVPYIMGYVVIVVVIASLFGAGYLKLQTQPQIPPGYAVITKSPYTIINGTINLQPYPRGNTALAFWVQFAPTKVSVLTGNFTSDGYVDIFVAQPESPNFFVSLNSFSPAGYTYSTGNVSSGSFDIVLPPSEYQLVFVDFGSQPVNITFTKSVTITFVSQSTG